MKKDEIADVIIEKRENKYVLLAKNQLYNPDVPGMEKQFHADGKKYKKDTDLVKALYDKYIANNKEYVFGDSFSSNGGQTEAGGIEEMINSYIKQREIKKAEKEAV